MPEIAAMMRALPDEDLVALVGPELLRRIDKPRRLRKRRAPPALSRDRLRSRRKREVPARTINVLRLPKLELEIGRRMYPEAVERPRRRAECEDGARPCPYVGCRHHLYLDAGKGRLKLNFPDLEPDELADSCVLDLAERGGMTLEDVGGAMNLTRERVRQIEVRVADKLAGRREVRELRAALLGEGPEGARRRLPVLHDDAEDEV